MSVTNLTSLTLQGTCYPLWVGKSHSGKCWSTVRPRPHNGHSQGHALSWFAATVTSPATSCPSLLEAEITSIVTADTTRLGERGKGLYASGNSELFSVISTPLWDVISLPSMLYPSLYPQPFPCDFVPPCKGAQFFSCSLTMGSTTGLALDNTMMWKSRCVSSKSRPQEAFHVFHSLITLLPPPWKWHARVSPLLPGGKREPYRTELPQEGLVQIY